MLKISSFLLTGNINLSTLAADLKSVGTVFIPAFLIIATIWENFTSMDYDGLLKRLVFAFVVSVSGVGFLETGVELSMSLSDSLIDKYAKDSIILAPFQASKEEPKKQKAVIDPVKMEAQLIRKTGATSYSSIHGTTSWDHLAKNVSGLLSNMWAEVMFLIAYGALWFIGMFYTLAYSFLLTLIPFLSALSIFPPTRRAMEGVIFAITWCILTPIVCTVVLCVLHQMNTIDSTSSGMPNLSTLEYLIQYLGMVVVIFYAPMIATGIIGGKGIHNIGDKFADSAAGATMTVGKSLILGKAMAGMNGGLRLLGRGTGQAFGFSGAKPSNNFSPNSNWRKRGDSNARGLSFSEEDSSGSKVFMGSNSSGAGGSNYYRGETSGSRQAYSDTSTRSSVVASKKVIEQSQAVGNNLHGRNSNGKLQGIEKTKVNDNSSKSEMNRTPLSKSQKNLPESSHQLGVKGSFENTNDKMISIRKSQRPTDILKQRDLRTYKTPRKSSKYKNINRN